MNFGDPKLIKKFGSWLRVQVAFYDFLFLTGTNLCGKHFREKALESYGAGEWADGKGFYEDVIKQLEVNFCNPEVAWNEFLKTTK